MSIGRYILELEDAEKAAATERAAREQRKTVEESRTAAELAAVEKQIAEVKAQLDRYPDDPPECWPLRKKLVGLHNKHRDLLNQLNGGTHR